MSMIEQTPSPASFEHRSMFTHAREDIRASYFEGRHILPPTTEEFEALALEAAERPSAYTTVHRFMERVLTAVK